MTYITKPIELKDKSKLILHIWGDKDSGANKVMLLIHGAVEHALRYDDFSRRLNSEGFIVIAPDLPGHGLTGESNGVFSHFYGGFHKVVDDLIQLNDFVNQQYNGLDKYIFGHSMGSFFTRKLISIIGGEYKKAVISESSWGNTIEAKGGLFFSNILGGILGKEKPNKFYNDFFWNVINSKIKNRKTTVDFISRDEKVVEDYLNDEMCGKTITLGFGIELTKLLLEVRKTEVFANTPKNLEILIISGIEDPLSNKGKDLEKIAGLYKSNGVKKVELILYDEARHEVLNELNKEEVYDDVVAFLNNNSEIRIQNS